MTNFWSKQFEKVARLQRKSSGTNGRYLDKKVACYFTLLLLEKSSVLLYFTTFEKKQCATLLYFPKSSGATFPLLFSLLFTQPLIQFTIFCAFQIQIYVRGCEKSSRIGSGKVAPLLIQKSSVLLYFSTPEKKQHATLLYQ